MASSSFLASALINLIFSEKEIVFELFFISIWQDFYLSSAFLAYNAPSLRAF